MNLAGEYSDRGKAYPADVEGVILAAGFSKRAGVFKPTLNLFGKPILARCIEGMYDFCSKLIVVGGYRAADISFIDYFCRTVLRFLGPWQEKYSLL